jgi:hypothetical protein
MHTLPFYKIYVTLVFLPCISFASTDTLPSVDVLVDGGHDVQRKIVLVTGMVAD